MASLASQSDRSTRYILRLGVGAAQGREPSHHPDHAAVLRRGETVIGHRFALVLDERLADPVTSQHRRQALGNRSMTVAAGAKGSSTDSRVDSLTNSPA